MQYHVWINVNWFLFYSLAETVLHYFQKMCNFYEDVHWMFVYFFCHFIYQNNYPVCRGPTSTFVNLFFFNRSMEASLCFTCCYSLLPVTVHTSISWISSKKSLPTHRIFRLRTECLDIYTVIPSRYSEIIIHSSNYWICLNWLSTPPAVFACLLTYVGWWSTGSNVHGRSMGHFIALYDFIKDSNMTFIRIIQHRIALQPN